ncbi:hypothetical protein niasHT_024595 [Heterodera trifolii]|uniref:Uncharacterized protein n=1 Tax=Heterodera trifolii TaxID=157864 RepID=A0ABD2K7I9_9BILA
MATTNSSSTTVAATSWSSSSTNSGGIRKRSSNNVSGRCRLFLLFLVLASMLVEMAQADVCQCGPRCASYKHELHCSRCCTSVMKRSVPFLNYPAEQLEAFMPKQQYIGDVDQQRHQLSYEEEGLFAGQIGTFVGQKVPTQDGIIVDGIVDEPHQQAEIAPEVMLKLDDTERQAVRPINEHRRLGHLLRGKRHLHAMPSSSMAQLQEKQLYALSPRRRR